MVTKKRPATPKVGEAAAEYCPRPLSELFWLAFQDLPQADKGTFFEKLLADEDLREDLLDSIVIINSRGQPTRRPTPLKIAASPAIGRPLGEVFWLAYRELSEADRDAFLRLLLDDADARDDLLMSIITIDRRAELHPEYEAFLAEIESERTQ